MRNDYIDLTGANTVSQPVIKKLFKFLIHIKIKKINKGSQKCCVSDYSKLDSAAVTAVCVQVGLSLCVVFLSKRLSSGET